MKTGLILSKEVEDEQNVKNDVRFKRHISSIMGNVNCMEFLTKELSNNASRVSKELAESRSELVRLNSLTSNEWLKQMTDAADKELQDSCCN